MPDSRQSLGRLGEAAAWTHLKRLGYSLLDRNWRCPRGEIDLVAVEGDVVCFVEVKTRASDEVAAPEASVTRAKQARLRRLAGEYLRRARVRNVRCRFDVVSVLKRPGSEPEVKLFRNAF